MATSKAAPVRIQRKRTKGWKMPEGAVYVGRPTKWGNPFRIGGYFLVGSGVWKWLEAASDYADDRFTLLRDATMAVEFYRRLTRQNPIPCLQELRGRDLACWCPLDQPCHADVLLELANAAPPEPKVREEANDDQ